MRTHYSKDVNAKLKGKTVEVAGWVQTVRQHGKIWFVKVRDREGTIQVTLPKGKGPDKLFDIAADGTPESVISAKGTVQITGDVVEVIPSEINLLSKAEVPLPLDISGKIDSELDTRLTTRFMDLRQTKIKAIFMVRDAVTTGIRDYLENQGFIEIHTPKIVTAGTEGGATLFPIKYFGQEAYLSQSPQLFKQMMMATGFDKAYEIAPYFRAEKSATTRHVAEFTQLDIELAFIDSQEDIMKLTEKMLVHTIEHVKKTASEYLDILEIKLNKPKTPFARVTYEKAQQITEKKKIDTEAEKKLGDIMAKKGHEFCYITDYPLGEKPFYSMKKDAKHSHTFDLEYKGLELASGGQREHRYKELVENIKADKLNPKDFDFYLGAFKYGMPPHGGLGFGIDRFVKQMLNLPNIREAVLFPRDLKRLKP